MTQGIANLEATIARLTHATTDAKEATREAHSATKALHLARKEADDARRLLEAAADQEIDDRLAAAVRKGLAEYTDTTKDAIAKSRENVMDQMSRWANLCMYGNEQGRGPNIFDDLRGKALEMQQEIDQHRQRRP